MSCGCVEKVVSFVRAVTSRRLPPDAVEARLSVCEACDQCEKDGRQRFCKACGCPKWRLSDLRNKAKMSRATCPLGKWPSIGDA